MFWYDMMSELDLLSMKHHLVELVVQLLCDWMIMGSKLGEPKLILFC